MRDHKRIGRGFAAMVFALTSGVASAAYTSLIAFGDSLLDNGNALFYNTQTPGVGAVLGYLVPTNPGLPPYPAGATQYTAPGGKSAVEVLAERLKLPPLLPSTVGGNNFATGGATTGFANFAGEAPIPGVPPGAFYPGLIGKGIRTQIAEFTSRLAGGPADSNALYVLWGGANDIFLNAALSLPQDPLTSVANLVSSVIDLYSLGARTILLPNLPDIGKAPGTLASPDPAAPAQATALTLFFNALLANAVNTLESGLGGLDIIPFDTFGAFNALLANAAALGFTNTTEACLALGAACDPAQFIFYDEDHPTPRVNDILGNLFFAAVVPEPRTMVLIALALCVLASVRHTRRIRRARAA